MIRDRPAEQKPGLSDLRASVSLWGTHHGTWRGLPTTVLRQLGVFHEPESLLGRICTLTTHPVTFARAVVRKFRK